MGRLGEAIECDLVVVGAGSAGAVVASRLSASGSTSVVLLEAGPDYSTRQTPRPIASIGPLELLDDDVAHTYLYPELTAARSVSQPAAPYRRGRGVGGSSAINGLFAVRPTVADLEEWAAAGCRGWSYPDLMPVLNAMESDLDFGHLDYHGDHGPVPVCRPGMAAHNALDEAFYDACVGLGHAFTPDHNAPNSTGVSPYAYNARGGRRVSTNDAYLEPARPRPNLRIRGNTTVDRVLLKGDRAVGVSALSGGTPLEVRASEVVLCAGAIHSPAVLLRSGIGPATDLAELGIEVAADLPVGLGLQDHPALAVVIRLSAAVAVADRRHAAWCLRFDTGDGDEADGGMISATATQDPGLGAVIGWVNRVESTGRVSLQSTDPRRDPAVAFNMLSDAVDLRRVRRVCRELAALTAAPGFEALGTSLGLLTGALDNTFLPIEEAMGDPDFDSQVLNAVFDVSHATSSCRMGDSADAATVVGSTGLVHGFANLRVADASVLPWVPRANTHLSAVLVGEKIASDLLNSSAL